MITGRPTKLDEELLAKAHRYVWCDGGPAGWTENGDVIPTVEAFASYLLISRETVYAWAKEHDYFSDIVDEIKNQQAQMLVNKGLEGKYNSTIAKLILSGKHGYVEKSEVDQNISGELKTGNVDPVLATEFSEFLKNKTKQE